MSSFSLDFSLGTFQPLAAKMRPQTLKQYCGQEHLIGAGKPLYKAIENGHNHYDFYRCNHRKSII